MTDRWTAEFEAIKSMADLMGSAEKTRMLYERAGLTLPETLKRLLGMSEVGSKAVKKIGIPAPEVQSRPSGYQDHWITVDLSHVLPITAIPAVLRKQSKPMRAKDLTDGVLSLLPTAASGSVVNSFTRLRPSIIDKTDEGWSLVSPSKAAVLHDGKLWGPPELFQKPEVASHRRDAILHILRHFDSGLQAIQILEQLQAASSWVHAPLTKDLIKEDLLALDKAGRIARRGHSKKWALREDARS